MRAKADPNFIERHLFVDGFEDESESIARLIPPKGATFEDSDTRIWQINHKYLMTEYIYCLAISPFLVSSISETESNEGKKVLELGLGGGSLDMFLHAHFPLMQITAIELEQVVAELAEKWFGVKNDTSRQTLIRDDLKFVEEAEQTGLSYDVIFLDACDLDKFVPCPAKNFRNPKIVKTMKKLLTNTGVLIVNMLPMKDDEEQLESAMKVFTDTFPSCLKFRLAREVNLVLACTKLGIKEPNSMMEFYRKRVVKLAHALGVPHFANSLLIK
ncbi:hypothetical protein WR25_11679 [Diploscapter pachys]|uniref:PABS domain-containing protein n=1 Tax=Diploscapter pachys TaxID=2018661 RepID=A0A2A2KPC2_9BILA|nr:hypothetical protein WR25_11679 [Diploscapter pachys]